MCDPACCTTNTERQQAASLSPGSRHHCTKTPGAYILDYLNRERPRKEPREAGAGSSRGNAQHGHLHLPACRLCCYSFEDLEVLRAELWGRELRPVALSVILDVWLQTDFPRGIAKPSWHQRAGRCFSNSCCHWSRVNELCLLYENKDFSTLLKTDVPPS